MKNEKVKNDTTTLYNSFVKYAKGKPLEGQKVTL